MGLVQGSVAADSGRQFRNVNLIITPLLKIPHHHLLMTFFSWPLSYPSCLSRRGPTPPGHFYGLDHNPGSFLKASYSISSTCFCTRWQSQYPLAQQPQFTNILPRSQLYQESLLTPINPGFAHFLPGAQSSVYSAYFPSSFRGRDCDGAQLPMSKMIWSI